QGLGTSEDPPQKRTPQRRAVAPAPEAEPAPAQPKSAGVAVPAATRRDDSQPEPRGMAMTDATRLRENALEDLARYEKAHQYQDALDALDEAIQHGANKAQLEETRVRLRGFADENRKVEDAFA